MFLNAVFYNIFKIFSFNADLPSALEVCHTVVSYIITDLTTAVYIILIFIKIIFYIKTSRRFIVSDYITIFLSIFRKCGFHRNLLLICTPNILIFFYIKIKLPFIFNNAVILNLFGILNKYMN